MKKSGETETSYGKKNKRKIEKEDSDEDETVDRCMIDERKGERTTAEQASKGEELKYQK